MKITSTLRVAEGQLICYNKGRVAGVKTPVQSCHLKPCYLPGSKLVTQRHTRSLLKIRARWYFTGSLVHVGRSYVIMLNTFLIVSELWQLFSRSTIHLLHMEVSAIVTVREVVTRMRLI